MRNYMHVCIYMFKYVFLHKMYMIHIYFNVWCICDTHLCICAWECMHVWRIGKEKWRREKYVCICTYINTWVCMCEFMYASIYRHEYVYVWVYVSVCLSIMHVYLYWHIYVLLYTWVWIRMHGCIWASTYMYIPMWKCKSMCGWVVLFGRV